MNISTSLSQLIGNTPMLELRSIQRRYGLEAKLIAKLERFNPMGSVKDRAAAYMIEQAEKQGRLQPDAVVVEPTSGNMGIGLALVCAAKGYRLIITMPETMSLERRVLLTALGAELRLTPGNDGMKGAIEEAQRICRELGNAYMPMQFENEANVQAHRETTGEEIWRDTEGRVDIFVAGVGTGGTITGVAQALKARNPKVQIVAVEPDTSAVLTGGPARPHKIQGIGAGFIPKILDRSLIDQVIAVSGGDSFERTAELARCEGVFAGMSSGAVLQAGIQLAGQPENKEKNIVLLLADSGEKYLSTTLFQSAPQPKNEEE